MSISSKTTATLETVLQGLAIALSALHNAGVTLGHFKSTDFIPIAESVSEIALSALQTPTPAQPTPAQSPTLPAPVQ